MHQRTHVLLRLIKYSVLGIVPTVTNLSVFTFALHTGAVVGLANMLGFIAGGQASFWVHDRFTFSDRHPTIHGWQRRWAFFMPGNFMGLAVNSLAAAVLLQLRVSTWWVYVGAMVCSLTFSFTWNTKVSHREPNTPPDSVEPD